MWREGEDSVRFDLWSPTDGMTLRAQCVGGLFVAVWACLIGCAPSDQATTSMSSDDPVNVLFLVADDLNCSLGFLGDTIVQTPHLDALAQKAVVFEQAHCQYPLCGPSRASFMTGMYPAQSGITQNRVMLRSVLPDVVTLAQGFRRHGHRSVRVGKIFHYDNPGDIGTSGHDDNPSWDETYNPRGRDKEEEHLIQSLVPGKFGGTLSWLASEGRDEEYTDGKVATQVVHELERFAESGEPFFLAAGFFRPHTPFVAPRAYFDLYDSNAMVVPASDPNELIQLPLPAQKSIRAKKVQRNLPSGRAKEIKQAYCASISFVDAQIGRVLTALRSTGLAENTVVVFLSDHGYHLGEHGHWQKQTLFEEATRVPLFILDPRHETANVRVPQPVELVDLYPTLNELAGIPTPEYVAGRSLVPRMREEVVESGGGALTQWRQGLSLRTSQHRLTMWGRDGELGMELYDHQEDPGEENNLALVPGHEALIDSLRGWMEEKTKSTSPLPPSIGRMNLDAPPMPWSPPLFRDGEVTPLLHSTPTTP